MFEKKTISQTDHAEQPQFIKWGIQSANQDKKSHLIDTGQLYLTQPGQIQTGKL